MPRRRGSRPKSQLALLVFAGVVALAGCDGTANSRQAQGPPPPIVEVATVTAGELRDALDLVGQLESDESVTIRPETRGVVAAVEFAEGQEVAAGTVLFRLRDEEQKARRAEAEAQLTLAEQSFNRAHALRNEQIMSRAELDRWVSERNAWRARLDLAQIELDRTQIRAPFHGMLGPRFVGPGDRVNDDTPLVQIDAVADLKLVFTVPERILSVLRDGLPVAVKVAPYPDRKFPGEIFFVAPAVDPRARRVLAKAKVPNPTRELRPGLFATIELEIARRADALVVPESAIVYSAEGDYVWRLGPENVAERAPVEVGLRRAGKAEIAKGLAPGDRIVTAGTNKVIPGQPVQPADGAVAPRASEGRAPVGG